MDALKINTLNSVFLSEDITFTSDLAALVLLMPHLARMYALRENFLSVF